MTDVFDKQREIEQRRKRMQRNCQDCVYYLRSGSLPICNYLEIVGHRRPCLPGAECMVKVKRKVYHRQRKNAIEEDGDV